MSEDLIRRSDAIKAVEECLKLLARPRYTVKTAIEAIPSVDIPHSDDWEKYSDKLWKNAYERGKADRPSGEWIRTFDGNEWFWYCSNCKTQWYEDDLWMGGNEFPTFCPNCGARMRPKLQGTHFDSIIIDECAMKGADDESTL